MKKKILASMIAMALSSTAFAEDTASSIRGKITDPQGDGAANTKITIVHVPSGTSKSITTNENGNFNASGLRVGGPYTITIDSDQFADQEYNDVYLQLGEIERLNVQLESVDSNTLVITGTRIPNTLTNGSSTIFGEQAIRNQTGTTRDIKDVIRANPLVSIGVGAEAPISIAGSNPRYNSFTVDGISQNDDFGLNDGGYPTQRSPLPIDAIDQVTIDVAPFDAKVSGFSGGLVNAVFKSGTNDFNGEIFFEQLNDSRSGTPTYKGERFDIEFEEETWGFGISGPIIEDKLFFNVSYEEYESPQTLEWGAGNSGAANETDATLADVAEVQRIAREVYGMTDAQVGSASGSPVEEDEKYVIKLDWNINDYHRAAFIYQYNLGNRTRNTTSGPGELRLSSHWYNVSEELNNFTTKLYSDWTSNFTSEISFTSKEVANRQVSFGDFADVTIQNLPGGGEIAFGSDQFRHANVLDTATDIVKFDGTYTMDEHTLEFGLEHQQFSVQNLFVPSSKGVIVFNSLADFEARLAERYTYSNGTGNDPFAVGADFDRSSLALYIQDNWDVNEDLNVVFGLRYESLSSNDKPPYNATSQARTGYDNTQNLDGIDILLPRIGFNYTVNDDLTIRGGIGRYSGGQPNVWISNAYSQNGVNEGFYTASNITIDPTSITGIYQPAFNAIENASSDGHVSFTDPNFELPSDWRYQIAADYMVDIPFLGDDFKWTTEFLHIKKVDSAFWIDASLHDAIVTTTADGQRLIYNDNDNRYDLMLTNSNVDGRSNIFMTSLDKVWDNGLSMSMSYANQDITDVNPGTSSTARSNYRYSDGINRNIPADQLGRSNFEIEHRFVLNMGYSTEDEEGYKTNINMFFERKSGNPITYTTNFAATGLNPGVSPSLFGGDYTTYIPTRNDPNVTYDPAIPGLEDDLMDAIKAAGLEKYAGGYAPKGTGTSPWVNSLDVSYNREIPGFKDGHKGVFTIIIDNFLNFVDSSKGKVVDNTFNTKRLYDVDSINAQGQYVIDRVRNDSNRFNAFESTWKIKIGVKYTF
ncbi:MAG: TonB-dependent receptor [Gammaproteobacteria bacterium]|nr:TonB-dependent receptor [Gammaproteobacteria bacterium]MDH5628565.1 TonB-dependent receptor [Gammaproteobacteria bacterium]